MFCEDAHVLRFAKYHGLGNDFVIIDRRGDGSLLSPEAVRALCDRHRGIGADGILSLCAAAEQPSAAGRMQTQNADGSPAEVCGNGLRCLARYLFDEGLVPGSAPAVELLSGERTYRIERLAPDRYRVEMGQAHFSHPDFPPKAAAGQDVELTLPERSFEAVCVHLGNPHAVIFCDRESPQALAERFGPALEHHPAFPQRANVSFARPTASGFAAVVHERGAGITQACGSGACAIAAAAVARGRGRAGTPIEIALPGGILTVSVAEDGAMTLAGEAARVFVGEMELP